MSSTLEELRAEMLARFPAKDATANHFKDQFYDCNEKAAGAWEELKAKRRELAMVHTKFDDLPVETETNDAHAKQLAKLEQSDIPDYRTKAERERKNWEHLFRTQILEKLHNALNEVVNLVTLLNTSLKKRPIGTNTYTLRYWLNRDYQLYHDLLQASAVAREDDLFFASAEPRFRDAIAYFLKTLTEQPDSAEAARLLDYRHYYEYDMEVLEEDGRKTSVDRHSGKFSGGENQSPYFIAILASYLRAYRRYSSRKPEPSLGLPSKLAEARRAIEELEANAELLTKMQTEVMRRDPAVSPEGAMAHARVRLDELANLLDGIQPLANAIDRRTAEFTRRSQARFRYLQETTSENRSRVQEFFETLNRHFAGRRVGELDELGIEFPALLLHDARIFGGMESLYTPRLRRAAGEIEPLADADQRQQDHALAQLGSTMRDSLTVSRANHFVVALPGKKGARIESDELLRDHVHNDEDVDNLIACLLHARSTDAQFEIQVPRRETEADSGNFDTKLQYRIERFTLLKK